MATTCTSLSQLKSAIMAEMRSAMIETQEKALDDMKEAINFDFYAGGYPVLYERTGRLGETPETTPLSESGNSITFDAKLNNSGGYSTGKNPSMQDVLELTNNGTLDSSVGFLKPAAGSTGYWKKAEERIEQDLNEAMSKHFG